MDRWIEGFESGGVYFDRDAKELVKLTNGTCILDHSSPEAYARTHHVGCVYTPSEAMALRVLGVTHNGDPIIGWTYRKVRAEALLRPVTNEPLNAPDAILNRVRRSRKIGRV